MTENDILETLQSLDLASGEVLRGGNRGCYTCTFYHHRYAVRFWPTTPSGLPYAEVCEAQTGQHVAGVGTAPKEDAEALLIEAAQKAARLSRLAEMGLSSTGGTYAGRDAW